MLTMDLNDGSWSVKIVYFLKAVMFYFPTLNENTRKIIVFHETVKRNPVKQVTWSQLLGTKISAKILA